MYVHMYETLEYVPQWSHNNNVCNNKTELEKCSGGLKKNPQVNCGMFTHGIIKHYK